VNPVEQQPARPPGKTLLGGVFALLRRMAWIVFSGVLFVFAVFLGGALLVGAVVGWGGGGDAEGRVHERHFSHNAQAADKVVIINLEGAILEGQGYVKRQIDQASKDDSVCAVVLRINSPGGTMTGSDYLYHHLTKLAREKKIPLVVSMGGMAASGGYYVAMAVGSRPDTIFAEPTTWTGSIGVIIPHFEAKELLEQKLGVRSDSVVSHPLKGIGTMTRPMTPEERSILQTLVNESFAQFKTVIRQGRPKFEKDPKALDVLATGQVYSAEQALGKGLVDKIGFVEDAVDRAIVLAGLAPEQVNVVEYKREFSLMGYLLESRAKSPGPDIAALMDLTVPRAYYLCSWLPPLAAGSQ
jgi:protease-4